MNITQLYERIDFEGIIKSKNEIFKLTRSFYKYLPEILEEAEYMSLDEGEYAHSYYFSEQPDFDFSVAYNNQDDFELSVLRPDETREGCICKYNDKGLHKQYYKTDDKNDLTHTYDYFESDSDQITLYTNGQKHLQARFVEVENDSLPKKEYDHDFIRRSKAEMSQLVDKILPQIDGSETQYIEIGDLECFVRFQSDDDYHITFYKDGDEKYKHVYSDMDGDQTILSIISGAGQPDLMCSYTDSERNAEEIIQAFSVKFDYYNIDITEYSREENIIPIRDYLNTP